MLFVGKSLVVRQQSDTVVQGSCRDHHITEMEGWQSLKSQNFPLESRQTGYLYYHKAVSYYVDYWGSRNVINTVIAYKWAWHSIMRPGWDR
jgi:hypothetical protein